MDRTASAVWHGGLKDGNGTLTTQSGVFQEQPYSFKTRFETEPGTNPEELIAAAHAGCFTMALSNILGEAGFKADELKTEAKVHLEMLPEGPTVTKIHLTNTGKVPGIDAAGYADLTAKAKAGCPISRLLKAAEITMEATLL